MGRRVIPLLIILLMTYGISYAYDDEDFPEIPDQVGLEAPDRLIEMDIRNDRFRVHIPSKKAEEEEMYRYRTVGFIVHTEETNGDPRSDSEGWGTLWLHEVETNTSFCGDDDEHDMLEVPPYSTSPDPYTVYSCKIPMGVLLDSAFIAGFNVYASLKDGKSFMLSPVFIVSDSNGNFRRPPFNIDDSNVYTSYHQIINPVEFSGFTWTKATQDSLWNYYDLPVVYSGYSTVDIMHVVEGVDWNAPAGVGILSSQALLAPEGMRPEFYSLPIIISSCVRKA